MKKLAALLCVTALTLSLSACGAGAASSYAASSAALSSAGTESSAVGSGAASSETAARPEHSTITMNVEGNAEEVPAALYQGKGYSLYIPDGGWAQISKLESDGSDCWQAGDNEKVLLQIARFEGVTDSADAEQQLMLGFGGVYDLQSEGGCCYTGSSDGIDVTFRLLGALDGDYYYLLNSCPAEAAEGFGARLDAITGTFELD